MNRRHFMQMGAAGGVLGLPASALSGSVPEAAKPVLSAYTAADHRRRLENIRLCEQGIRTCVRRHLIANYIPGHAVYSTHGRNWEPDAADDAMLAKLRAAGVGLLQPWSDWANDSWGRNHMAARNPAGFRRFLDLAHRHGLKVIPYTTTGFFERTDPNFRPEWAWPPQYDLVEHDYHLAHCSPSSPGWRAHLLPRMLRVMDEFDVDGLYNDMGYQRPGELADFYGPRGPVAKDEVVSFEESPTRDGAMTDLLALIYEEIKRRGGIYKIHKEGTDTVFGDIRVYDYLWVGEAVRDIDYLRRKTRNYSPYVAPQRLPGLKPDQETETFLNSIPFMQFPVLGHGQAGEQGEKYWTAFTHWLRRYLPMVEEGTRAYLDIGEADWFAQPLPREVVASAFANRDLYLVLANYQRTPVEIAITAGYVATGEEGAQVERTWKLGPRSLHMLRLQATGAGGVQASR